MTKQQVPSAGSGYLDLPERWRDPDTAAVVVVPVPYDATSTYVKGADKGPAAIIAASAHLEWYDIETASEPCARGIYTAEPVTVDGPPEELVPVLERAVGAVLDQGRLPVVLGGEHSISYGPVRAAHARFADLTVLQIDAHADTRAEYCGSRYNHACVMARIHELCPSVQVGIRAIDAAEAPGLDPDRVIFAHDIHADRADAWIQRAVDALSDHVYITLDMDGFDPALVPATGTPEPGGLTWMQVNDLVTRVIRSGKKLVGFDVVELCPTPGQHASDFVAAKAAYRIIAEHLHASG